MKIIKPGDVRKSREVRLFECKACGCIFEADSSEYFQIGWTIRQREFCCHCPTCGREVIAVESVFTKE